VTDWARRLAGVGLVTVAVGVILVATPFVALWGVLWGGPKDPRECPRCPDPR